MNLEHKLHPAAQALSAEYDLEPAMTPRQVVFLDQLSTGGSMNQTNIANATGIDRTTTATMARTLPSVMRGTLRVVAAHGQDASLDRDKSCPQDQPGQ